MAEDKRLGGITGKGFLPGQTGNPTGKSKVQAALDRAFRDYVEGDVVFKRKGEGEIKKKRLEALFEVLDLFIFQKREWRAIEFLLRRIAPETLVIAGKVDAGFGAVAKALAEALNWKLNKEQGQV